MEMQNENKVKILLLILSVFFALYSKVVFAQFPSFELYCNPRLEDCGGENFTPYPYVDESSFRVRKYLNYIVITVRAFDVSGISSLVAAIRYPENHSEYMNSKYGVDGRMFDDGAHQDGEAGDGMYGVVIDVSNRAIWDHSETYVVDISATDGLSQNSVNMTLGRNGEDPFDFDYANVGNFGVDMFYVCEENNGGKVCINPIVSEESSGQIKSFTASPASIRAGIDEITLSVDLDGLANQEIIFTDQRIQKEIGTARTNSSGLAILKYKTTPGVIMGPHEIRASYEGGIGRPDTALITITVTAGYNCKDRNGGSVCVDASASQSSNQISSFVVSPTTIKVGEAVTLTANLGLANQTITFRDLTADMNIGSATTSSSGVATFQYQTSIGTEIGNHTLMASYAGGAGTPDTKTAILNIAPDQTLGTCRARNGGSVCITASASQSSNQISSFVVSPTTIKVGEAVTLTANLGLANQAIIFRDQTAGANIGSATTSSSGVATFQYQTSIGTEIGNHTLMASYAGGAGTPDTKTVILNVAADPVLGTCKTKNGGSICLKSAFSSTNPQE